MARNEDTEMTGVELHSTDDTTTTAGDRKVTKDKNNCERAVYILVHQ